MTPTSFIFVYQTEWGYCAKRNLCPEDTVVAVWVTPVDCKLRFTGYYPLADLLHRLESRYRGEPYRRTCPKISFDRRILSEPLAVR